LGYEEANVFRASDSVTCSHRCGDLRQCG